jgi:hypothetical protein
MTALSDSHLALGSNSDTKIRVFESVSKKIHSFNAHTEPINFLSKIISEERFLNSQNYSADNALALNLNILNQ